MLSWDNWTGDIAALEDLEPEQTDDVDTGSVLSSSEERCGSRDLQAAHTRELMLACFKCHRGIAHTAVITAGTTEEVLSRCTRQRVSSALARWRFQATVVVINNS